MDRLIFSDSFLFKTTEKIIPGAVSHAVLSEHFARYFFATNYCSGKIVLNTGCGCGYGSEVLLQKAKEVYNIDISESLIAYGSVKYAKDNNHFMVMDAQDLKLKNNFFDCVVAFELIEHLANPYRFLLECHRVLKKSGRLILSTPNKAITSPQRLKPYNPYHVNEFTIQNIKKMIKKYFTIESFYGQKLMQPVILNSWQRLYLKLIQFFVQITPGVIFRIVKQYILGYQELGLNEITVDKGDRVRKIDEEVLSLNNSNKTYGIIVLILKKFE